MENKELQEIWSQRVQLREGLEKKLKKWAKEWTEPGEIPLTVFSVNGIECVAINSFAMGGGFNYLFQVGDQGLRIGAFVLTPRKRAKRVAPPLPEGAE